jgi:hypothetical protein
VDEDEVVVGAVIDVATDDEDLPVVAIGRVVAGVEALSDEQPAANVSRATIAAESQVGCARDG